MIIVRLKGGMGNQMFQYALGRRLSHDLNTELKLDVSGFDKVVRRVNPLHLTSAETKRQYDLHHFNIIENFASTEEILPIKYPLGILSKFENIFKTKILRQFHIGFEPSILKKKGDFYLDGLWHSEKYFESIRDILLKEFSLKNPLSEEAQLIAKEINESSIPTVSLHVRRGDYANDPATLNYHGLLGTQYYEEALDLLRQKMKMMKVFIFSDDIEWVKKNIKIDDPHVYVTTSSIPYFEEPDLMSLCQHNIIANSSFSWWGAWLNQNPDKIVIAPQKWLAKTGNDYYEEIPQSWMKI